MSVALFVSLVSMKPSEYSRLFKKVNSPFKHTHGRLTVRENRYTPKHLVHRHSRNRTVSIYFIVLQREQTVTLSSYSAPKRKKKKRNVSSLLSRFRHSSAILSIRIFTFSSSSSSLVSSPPSSFDTYNVYFVLFFFLFFFF